MLKTGYLDIYGLAPSFLLTLASGQVPVMHTVTLLSQLNLNSDKLFPELFLESMAVLQFRINQMIDC